MAKPFYSLEEASSLLGKSQDQIKELVRDGRLREFRDAGKIFFKAEDIEKLRGAEGGPAAGDSGEVLLEAVEEPAPPPPDPDDMPSLVSSSGGTSIIGLEPMEEEREEEKKEDTVITASGIGVFDDDELEIDADPMAKTQITTGAVDDQVSLESSGSGSGLLDLTRESDDTSLGAELLDEIYPGEEEAAAAEPEAEVEAETTEETVAEVEEEEDMPADAGEAVIPVVTVTSDPSEGIFGGFMVGTLLLAVVAAAVVGGLLQGFVPDYAGWLAVNFWIFLGSAFGVLLVCVAVGWFMGRATGARR